MKTTLVNATQDISEEELDELIAEYDQLNEDEPMCDEDSDEDEDDEKVLTVDEYLDEMSADQEEWDRLQNDLFPGTGEEVPPARVHKDTDPEQSYLAAWRQV